MRALRPVVTCMPKSDLFVIFPCEIIVTVIFIRINRPLFDRFCHNKQVALTVFILTLSYDTTIFGNHDKSSDDDVHDIHNYDNDGNDDVALAVFILTLSYDTTIFGNHDKSSDDDVHDIHNFDNGGNDDVDYYDITSIETVV
ncbi:hypothetical protein BsWGS_26085 [Bradybaena similaris]